MTHIELPVGIMIEDVLLSEQLKIIYGMSDRFSEYDINAPVSKTNQGGGINWKAQRVIFKTMVNYQ